MKYRLEVVIKFVLWDVLIQEREREDSSGTKKTQNLTYIQPPQMIKSWNHLIS